MRRFFAILSAAAIASGCAGAAGQDVGDAEVGPIPDAAEVGGTCASAADCDDLRFCDGVEDCVGGRCVASRSFACRDLGGCAIGTCDESAGSCTFDVPAGASCPATTICRPASGCTAVDGCTGDADPRCDDGRACTDDLCDGTTGACVHVPVDARCEDVGACGRGVCLGAASTESSGCGVAPDAAKCAVGEGCATDGACDALASACAHDADCDDGTLCDGRERCVDGACVHAESGTTCVSPDRCHHAVCRVRNVGEGYCEITEIVGCT